MRGPVNQCEEQSFNILLYLVDLRFKYLHSMLAPSLVDSPNPIICCSKKYVLTLSSSNWSSCWQTTKGEDPSVSPTKKGEMSQGIKKVCFQRRKLQRVFCCILSGLPWISSESLIQACIGWDKRIVGICVDINAWIISYIWIPYCSNTTVSC